MKAKTRIFGEIDIADDKIIKLEKGIIGFPDLKNFTLIFEEAEEKNTALMWLQSMDEPQFALPVISPNDILPEYNPIINDSLLGELGDLSEENTCCYITIKVPKDITKMTVNLKAPIIINTDNLKGAQLIVEDDLDVRFPVYELLKEQKEKAGE